MNNNHKHCKKCCNYAGEVTERESKVLSGAIKCGVYKNEYIFDDQAATKCEFYNVDTSNLKMGKNCRHFVGLGDWNLCCDIKYGLCYSDTPGCEDFELNN